MQLQCGHVHSEQKGTMFSPLTIAVYLYIAWSQYFIVLWYVFQMRTALHLACLNEHIDAALLLASHDPSTLDAFDRVSLLKDFVSVSSQPYKRGSHL